MVTGDFYSTISMEVMGHAFVTERHQTQSHMVKLEEGNHLITFKSPDYLDD